MFRLNINTIWAMSFFLFFSFLSKKFRLNLNTMWTMTMCWNNSWNFHKLPLTLARYIFNFNSREWSASMLARWNVYQWSARKGFGWFNNNIIRQSHWTSYKTNYSLMVSIHSQKDGFPAIICFSQNFNFQQSVYFLLIIYKTV